MQVQRLAVKASEPTNLPGEVSWERWSGLYTDDALWAPAVRDVCRALSYDGPGMISATYPGSCAVFAVDERLIVKFFPPLLALDWHRERAMYRHMAASGIPLALLLAEGSYQHAIEWPFLVFGFVRGVALREIIATLDTEARCLVAGQVGTMLHALAGLPVVEAPPFRPWLEFLAQRRQACIPELAGVACLPAHLLGAIAAFLDQMLPLLRVQQAIYVHADLTADHVLLACREDGWQVTALIDWADAEVGPQTYEWVAAWFGMCGRDPLMFEALLSAAAPQWRADQALQQFLLAHTFLHRFGATMIADLAEKEGCTPPPTLPGLQRWLWPGAG